MRSSVRDQDHELMLDCTAIGSDSAQCDPLSAPLIEMMCWLNVRKVT